MKLRSHARPVWEAVALVAHLVPVPVRLAQPDAVDDARVVQLVRDDCAGKETASNT